MFTPAIPFIQAHKLFSDTSHNEDPGDVQLPDLCCMRKPQLSGYFDRELDLSRLNIIHGWLWRAGLPEKVQPLHHQKLLQREIVLTERVDLHLVWSLLRDTIICHIMLYAYQKHLKARPQDSPNICC